MRFLIRPVLLAACWLAACGGGGDGSQNTPPPSGGTNNGTQETIFEVDCDNAPAFVTIDIRSQTFTPREVKIPNGGIVRWINNDTLTHDVTSGEPNHGDAGARFDSGNLAPGERFCVRLSGDLSVDYFCEIHPAMQGEIDVGTVADDDNP